MFEVYASHNQLTLRRQEPMTSGAVNAYQVCFTFSEDWAGLTRTAVFKAGLESRSLLLGEDGVCTIPWEVLRIPEYRLYAGVCGTRDDEIVLPTTWVDFGIIGEGAVPGSEAHPPTPQLWEQVLAGKGDALDCDGRNLSLVSGGRPISTVQLPGDSCPPGRGLEVYSEEEQEVGTWIDGSPVYQRTFVLEGVMPKGIQYTTILGDAAGTVRMISASGNFHSGYNSWPEQYIYALPYVQYVNGEIALSLTIGSTYGNGTYIWLNSLFDVDSPFKAVITIRYYRETAASPASGGEDAGEAERG